MTRLALAGISSKAKNPFFLLSCGDEKLQLIKRLPAPIIRYILDRYRNNDLSAVAAVQELGISLSSFYKLYSQYLAACAQGQSEVWLPGVSGGNHHPAWPTDAVALLKKLLTSKPPSSYSACASELHRRLDFKTNRACVRRWAIQNQIAPDTRYKASPKPVKRWQSRDLGALWQYDASPHTWLPGNPDKQALLDILDDATRYNTGARLYPRETLLAHLDFLSGTFKTHGLPLALYVDFHSFFFTHTPDAFTQLGKALHFYGVALRYAPTPQAKGKIERRHDYWQKRLPPLLAADNIRDLQGANHLLEKLLSHANQHEIHRELGTTPHLAMKQACAEKRSVLRHVPPCPWWPFVWSQQTSIRVGDDGKVPVGSQRHTIHAPPKSKVIRCLRPDGDIYYLLHAPNPKNKPIVLLHCPVF